MGSAGSRFGRNVPLDQAWPDTEPELLTPSPREVSRQLMTRDVFKPATTLNVLAAAWIQFQNHEWFTHRTDQSDFLNIPLADNDNWHENPMRIERTMRDPTRHTGPSQYPPNLRSEETHWWESRLYGSSFETQRQVRSGDHGKLRVEANGLLPLDPDPTLRGGVDLTGFNKNYWVGLEPSASLFVLEHNAICDRLHQAYSSWNDDRLFETARLINAALMAKIHTVEWTPGILGHPALQVGMRANWWGLAGERLTRLLGRLGTSEVINGIPGSPVDHHTAPFYLTEEFVSVYRMHPLIPDEFELYALENDQRIDKLTFTDMQGINTRAVMQRIAISDLFYLFGLAHPGAITLHNFPRALQAFQRPDGHLLDLAAVDVLRDRERGVPRYNQFRQLLRMPRVKSFAQLTDNPQWARELHELYQGDIDRVDLLVGLYAEPVPRASGSATRRFGSLFSWRRAA